jgi:hypothetical protein
VRIRKRRVLVHVIPRVVGPPGRARLLHFAPTSRKRNARRQRLSSALMDPASPRQEVARAPPLVPFAAVKHRRQRTCSVMPSHCVLLLRMTAPQHVQKTPLFVVGMVLVLRVLVGALVMHRCRIAVTLTSTATQLPNNALAHATGCCGARMIPPSV